MELTWQTILVNSDVAILPKLLQLIEAVHVRRPGARAYGVVKAGAAVHISQSVLQMAATAGAIPGLDAQNTTAIAGLVQQVVTEMQAAGQLSGFGSGTAVINAPPPLEPGMPLPGDPIDLGDVPDIVDPFDPFNAAKRAMGHKSPPPPIVPPIVEQYDIPQSEQ